MPTDAYAPWIGLALLALAIAIRLAWRAKWRRDDRRARALAAGIADERRISLMEPDPTPYEDEPTEEIPVVTLREESIPLAQTVEKYPLVPAGWVEFRGGLVHVRCLDPLLRNDARPCAGCAVHLDHVLTGAA
jgi:hypothetical protein